MAVVLLTGGMGYIGSHTCVELVRQGWDPVILDNLANSSARVLKRIERITGRRIFLDVAAADPDWRVMLLRYFNPVGAHASGLIGEDPVGVSNNLLSFVAQVVVGQRRRLKVYGSDHPTADGTGVRDYVHVVNLATGHVAALGRILRADGPRELIVNLGTGRGYSVLQMVRAFEAAGGKTVPFDIVDRCPGDLAVCYADVSRAATMLGWRACRGIVEMCAATWRWQNMNPHGFRG